MGGKGGARVPGPPWIRYWVPSYFGTVVADILSDKVCKVEQLEGKSVVKLWHYVKFIPDGGKEPFSVFRYVLLVVFNR